MKILLGAKRRLRVAAVTALLAGVGPSLDAQTPGGIAWWQSFTTPASPLQQVLTEIGFTSFQSASVTFDIFAFNGTSYLTGASLWQTTVTNVLATDVLRLHPMITLPRNAFFAITLSSTAGMGAFLPSDSYPGGQFYVNNGPTTSVSPHGPNDFNGFEVQFSAVPVTPTPEPTTLVLVGLGFLGIGIGRTRRTRARGPLAMLDPDLLVGYRYPFQCRSPGRGSA